MKTSSVLEPAVEQNQHARDAIAKSIEAYERYKMKEKAQGTSKQDREHLRALRAPLENLIAKDAAASRALEQLRKHPLVSIPPFVDKLEVSNHASSQLLTLHLAAHLSMKFPPYDYGWQWGNPLDAVHNEQTGNIGVRGVSDSDHEWAVSAASGIGLLLTTDKPALVSVRPYIQYEWEGGARVVGYFASGKARGGIDAAAFDNGRLVAGVRQSELFSKETSSDPNTGWDDGVVWVDDIALDFGMDPGQAIVVNFGAFIECSHSDTHIFGAAGAGAKVQAHVRWVVVERFVAG